MNTLNYKALLEYQNLQLPVIRKWIGFFIIALCISGLGFLIFWIVLLLIKLGNRVYERALFRAALTTGFIMAATTSIIMLHVFGLALSDGYVFTLFIIPSAIISIMIHFNHFKKINN